jgi:hypothetical protein
MVIGDMHAGRGGWHVHAGKLITPHHPQRDRPQSRCNWTKLAQGGLVACPPSSHNWLPCALAKCASALNHNVCAALVQSSSITRCCTTTPPALSQPRRGWPFGGAATPLSDPQLSRETSLSASENVQTSRYWPICVANLVLTALWRYTIRGIRDSTTGSAVSGHFTETSFVQQLTRRLSHRRLRLQQLVTGQGLSSPQRIRKPSLH